MNRLTGLILAAALGGLVGACASGGGGGPSADGFRPRDTDETREAEQSLALAMVRSSDAEKQQLYQQALQSAQQAITEDSTNPQGWVLAGQAHSALGHLEEADAAWDKAVELYPSLEQELVGDRENAWVVAYNDGVNAFQQNDIEGAIDYMELADMVYQGRPEAKLQLGMLYSRQDQMDRAIQAYRDALEIIQNPPPIELDSAMQAAWAENEQIAISNLAQLLAATGQDAEAEQVYRDVLASNPEDIQALINLAGILARQGRSDEANQMFNDLVSREGLSFDDYIRLGVGLFQAEQYDGAAIAFEKAVGVNPYSRDAYYNLAQSLYVHAGNLEDQRDSASAAEAGQIAAELGELYADLATATEKVLELDPFNRNVLAYQARAFQALSELDADGANAQSHQQAIQDAVARYEEMPFEMIEVNLVPGEGEVSVSGRIMNVSLASGAPVRLRITLLDIGGATIGAQEVTISAPAQNESAAFDATIPVSGDLAGWKYERMQ